MVAQCSVDVLFYPLGGRGREVHEAVEMETRKISSIVETFNCIDANISFSGLSSQKTT